MARRNFKQWTKEERSKSGAMTRRMKAAGLIGKASKCCKCGQDKGIIQLHNEDYDTTLEIGQNVVNRIPMSFEGDEKDRYMGALLELCWTCHMILHSEHRNKTAHDNYFEAVKNGARFAPVFRHDFSELKKYGF